MTRLRFPRLPWRFAQVWLCLSAIFIVTFVIYFQALLHIPLKATWISSTILPEHSNQNSSPIQINHPTLNKREKTLPRHVDSMVTGEVGTLISPSVIPLATTSSNGASFIPHSELVVHSSRSAQINRNNAAGLRKDDVKKSLSPSTQFSFRDEWDSLLKIPDASYNIMKKKNYIQKVIKQTIKLWEAELSSYPGVKPPKKEFSGQVLPLQKIRRVLIVSSWRSGSSFLGEILSSYPGTFYSFEPLHYFFQLGAVDKKESIPKSIDLLKNLLTCNISSYEMYGEYLKNHPFLMRRNEIAWRTCSLMWNLCFDNEFLQDLCQILPLNLIKTVRIGLEPIEYLLKDPSLDLRVIYLIRDPRGSLLSRKKVEWCIFDVCSDPATVCENLLTDLNAAEKYSQKYPGRFLLVRYEDLSLKSEEVTKDILKLAGLPFHPSMEVFLKRHTKLGPEVNETLLGPYTTFRDSQSVIFAWRENLTFSQVENIQKSCGKVLNKLHLYSFKTQEEYANPHISVLE